MQTRPDYPLTSFLAPASVDRAIVEWMEGGWRKFVLLLFGPGGWGETEFACAIMHMVAPARRYYFLNQADQLRDVKFRKGEGLILDEQCWANRAVDDVKALLDLAKTRQVIPPFKKSCHGAPAIPKLT